MNTKPLPFKKIILICTNVREAGERVCCGGRDSIALHADLKQWVKDNRLHQHVRVSKSGCMHHCEEGPNVLVMPDNVWISGMTAADLETLKSELLAEFACNT